MMTSPAAPHRSLLLAPAAAAAGPTVDLDLYLEPYFSPLRGGRHGYNVTHFDGVRAASDLLMGREDHVSGLSSPQALVQVVHRPQK